MQSHLSPAVSSLTFAGHGDGHGIGMGQYGAVGYALGGWSYQQILSHYYGGTQLGTLPSSNPLIRVVLTANDGADIIVTSQSNFSVDGKQVPAGDAVMLHESSPGVWAAFVGPGCSGPWPVQPELSGLSEAQALVVPASSSPTAPISELLGLCEADGVHHYRGEIEAADYQGNPRTVNVVALQSYLEGVVPAEMPASWGVLGAAGNQGQPAGFQALEAQAVAARSYAMSGLGRYGYADICDSDACQVYDDVDSTSSAPYAPADLAVADTVGQVLLSGGSVADTEYSASTGGWTAGGPFPAVVDSGDSVCIAGEVCNPWHDWTQTVQAGTIESAWPSVGVLTSVAVDTRNGDGDWGGRVLTLTVQGDAGSETVSGSYFAGVVGLPSDYFEVTSQPTGSLSTSTPKTPLSGYYVATSSGAVFDYGNASAKASLVGTSLDRPLEGMAATSDGQGLWLDASDGGIFAFGDARFYGSMGGKPLDKPVVGMAPTSDGNGYWEVASDGGIFAFGDARFYGSMGGKPLNEPVVGMAPTPDGNGYWEVASDGGIFSFGDARFYGSLPGIGVHQTAVGMIPTSDGLGYEILTSSGGVYSFGDAPALGAPASSSGWSGTAIAIAPS